MKVAVHAPKLVTGELTRLVEAMTDGRCVEFVYDNKTRIVEVHAIGTSTKDGSIVVRGVQVGGEASRPLPQWTLFTQNKMLAVRRTTQRAEAPREGYTQGDKQMAIVIAELDLAAPVLEPFPVQFTVEPQQIADNIVAAIEGGSTYWLGKVEPVYQRHQDYSEAAAYGADMIERRFTSDDGDNTGVLNRETISKALALMATVAGGRHLGDLLAENGDADTGDVLLQLAVFGELIYG